MKNSLIIIHYGECNNFNVQQLTTFYSVILNALNVNIVQDCMLNVSIKDKSIQFKCFDSRTKDVLVFNKKPLYQSIPNFKGYITFTFDKSFSLPFRTRFMSFFNQKKPITSESSLSLVALSSNKRNL